MSNKPDPDANAKPRPLPPRDEREHSEAAADEALVDDALVETMDASDPISPYSRETSQPVELKDGEPSAGDKNTEPPAKWQGWKRGE